MIGTGIVVGVMIVVVGVPWWVRRQARPMPVYALERLVPWTDIMSGSIAFRNRRAAP